MERIVTRVQESSRTSCEETWTSWKSSRWLFCFSIPGLFGMLNTGLTSGYTCSIFPYHARDDCSVSMQTVCAILVIRSFIRMITIPRQTLEQNAWINICIFISVSTQSLNKKTAVVDEFTGMLYYLRCLDVWQQAWSFSSSSSDVSHVQHLKRLQEAYAAVWKKMPYSNKMIRSRGFFKFEA